MHFKSTETRSSPCCLSLPLHLSSSECHERPQRFKEFWQTNISCREVGMRRVTEGFSPTATVGTKTALWRNICIVSKWVVSIRQFAANLHFCIALKHSAEVCKYKKNMQLTDRRYRLQLVWMDPNLHLHSAYWAVFIFIAIEQWPVVQQKCRSLLWKCYLHICGVTDTEKKQPCRFSCGFGWFCLVQYSSCCF